MFNLTLLKYYTYFEIGIQFILVLQYLSLLRENQERRCNILQKQWNGAYKTPLSFFIYNILLQNIHWGFNIHLNGYYNICMNEKEIIKSMEKSLQSADKGGTHFLKRVPPYLR